MIQLPFSLRMSSAQTFTLQVDGTTVVLRFINPERKEAAALANTIVAIDSTKSMEEEGNWALQAFTHINNVIRAYRIVTKEVFNQGMINQLTWDQFLRATLCGEIDKNGKFIGKPKMIYASIGLEPTPIDEQEYMEIKRLADSPSLMLEHSLDEILVQANSFLEQHNFRMTILEAVIALELAVSSIVRNLAKKKGIQEDKVEHFIVSLGLSQTLDVALSFMVSDALPPKEVISACKKANKIRNGIVHRACLTVSGEDAQEALKGIESFIQHFRQLIY
jgi:hypothetical protein